MNNVVVSLSLNFPLESLNLEYNRIQKYYTDKESESLLVQVLKLGYKESLILIGILTWRLLFRNKRMVLVESWEQLLATSLQNSIRK